MAAREAWSPADAGTLDRLAFIMLLAFAVCVPWLAGAVLPADSAGRLATPVGGHLVPAIAFAIGAAAFFSRSSFRSFRPFALPVSALLALTLFGALQLVPLPDAILEQIAPANSQIYHESAEILRLYGKSPPPLARISIAPEETTATVLQLGGYAALLLSAWALLRQRPRRRLFAGLLLVSAALHVLLAAAWSPPGQPCRGAFPAAGGFAAYLLILLPLGFAAIWAEILTSSDRGRDLSDPAERIAERIPPFVIRCLCWATLAAGIALTKAPLAMLAAAIGALVMILLALRHRNAPRRAVGRVALGLAMFPLVWTGTQLTSPAVAIWRTCLDAWRKFPLFGAGLGAFSDAFRRVQPRELTGLVENAKSDLLQLLVTGGVIGELLGLLAFFSLLALLLRGWKAQKHREESALALAGFGALFSFGLDGLVEFNLGTPAVPATLACILGLALAAGSNGSTGPMSTPLRKT